jgi:RNA-directed DNA polymerase
MSHHKDQSAQQTSDGGVYVCQHLSFTVVGKACRRNAKVRTESGKSRCSGVATCKDLSRGESFGFLGFDFRCIRSQRGVWRANATPKLKKRTALLRKLKAIFRRYRSQPIDRVIQLINPILRGWVNYFAVGNSGECFSFIQDWVEKKVRRHMMKARKRQGFGWTRWSSQWLYDTLKLFNGYKVRWPQPKVAPAG